MEGCADGFLPPSDRRHQPQARGASNQSATKYQYAQHARQSPAISVQNEFGQVGIGLRLDNTLQILEIVSGGPCENTAIQVGDSLIQIDGVSVLGKSLRDIVVYTMGNEGSQATLILKRGDVVVPQTIVRRFTKGIEPPSQPADNTINEQVILGFRKRDFKEIENVFKKYATIERDTSRTHIEKGNLLMALKEFDSILDVSNADIDKEDFLFRSLDRNQDGILSLDEFVQAVQAPSPLDEWADSLPLPQILIDAIPRKAGHDHMRDLGRLSQEDIGCIVEGFAHGLKRLLELEVKKLQDSFTHMDSDARAASKLAVEPCTKYQAESTKLRCGKIEDFYLGMSTRIGHAHLDFRRAMELEHCHGVGSEVRFETANYKIKTWAAKEWGIIVNGHVCPEIDMRYNRRIPDIKQLQQLAISIRAKLTLEEVIAAVLYSGPMMLRGSYGSQYFAYNAVLRKHPQELYHRYNDSDCLFPTTIHVLVSALHKISRVTEIKPGMNLYRGLGFDADLPELFYQTDEHGCSGFTEWGFMSTTARKEVAIQYSKVQEGNPLPRVLVISLGSVDRGACLKDFSQYPDEEEFLYAPFSFVEKFGPQTVQVTVSGVVEMISVRVNSNLKTKTVEELVAQKKDMHLTAFSYHIHEIEAELERIASHPEAEVRLQNDETREANHSVRGFVVRIVEQCKDVMSRHAAVNAKDYIKDQVFRGLVLEMLDVKLMAVSKLQEWLQNKSYSFIRFRWHAQLRTAHRRWLAFLEKRLELSSGADKQQDFAELCKYMGLIRDSVDEKNELSESRIMCAAAEGRAMRILRLLVDAGANVNESRPDGVTPMWLAAQFRHAWCIRSLHELNASVSQPANDGATPVYIAAQNGNVECIRVLAGLRADVNTVDNKGLAPIHQAAMNGHIECIDILIEQNADIKQRTSNNESPLDLARKTKHQGCAQHIERICSQGYPISPQRISSTHDPAAGSAANALIITTGDISDMDGFFALAEYAKTGSDVLFVMNYPAYVGMNPTDIDNEYEELNPGLGYRYGAEHVLGRKEKCEVPDGYRDFIGRYTSGAKDSGEAMKGAMTDLAFGLAVKTWTEIPGVRGRLYFCIGGINAINPFSETAIKNEVLVYHSLLTQPVQSVPTKQGLIYDERGACCEVDFKSYEDIYMDFNGSLAFWDESWVQRLSDTSVLSKMKGVFIMGGVLSDADPVTMPSIPKVLNRFSSATMNQLYHPQNAAEFFNFVTLYKIPAYVVTNNAVGDITTFAEDQKTKTLEGVERFMASNRLTGAFLGQLARAHYESVYNPPRKPFDFYTALALVAAMGGRGSELEGAARKTLFYSNVYGMCVVSACDTWQGARTEYLALTDRPPATEDAFAVKRYALFQKEAASMCKVERMASLTVGELRFRLSPDDLKLDLDLGPAPGGSD